MSLLNFIHLKKSDLRAVLVIGALSLLMFSLGIGKSSIYILGESENAQCAWEMMHSSDHVKPTFNGELRADKPPLHYYAMMPGYAIFGKTAFAARIMSSIAGAIFMMILFLFVSRHADRSAAVWSVLVLLSSMLWVVEFHLAVPDPYLIALIGTGLMTFFHFTETGKRWPLLIMYASLSLAFMAKGPVAVLLPGLIILLYLYLTKRLNRPYLFRMLPLHGAAIFLAVVLPWYLSVYGMTDGEWFMGLTSTKEAQGGIFLLTPAYILLGVFPFAVFVYGASGLAWKNRKKELNLFSLITIAVFLVFFSFSRTKLPGYTMPCLPFAAILFGLHLRYLTEHTGERKRGLWAGLWFLFGVSIAIPVAFTHAGRIEPLLEPIRLLGLPFVFMPAGTGAAIILAYRKRIASALYVVAGTFMLATLMLAYVIFPITDRFNPVSENTPLLEEAGVVRYFEKVNPSFIFRYGPIDRVTSMEEVATHLKDPANILITNMKSVEENRQYFEQYKIRYSGKDLFDRNQTVIYGGREPGRKDQ